MAAKRSVAAPLAMRRVLQVAYALDPGGAENVVVTLATRLDPQRFRSEVATLTTDGVLGDRLRSAGLPVHVIGKRSRVDSRALLRLRRLIHEGGFDLIHTHGPPPNLWTVLASPWGPLPRIVHTLHSPARGQFGPVERMARNFFCNRRNAAIVGVSPMVTESYRQVDPTHSDRYRTIYNGIVPLNPGGEDELARLRTELGLARETRVVGTVGNLRPPKAHADLLQAVALLTPRFPQLVLLIAGEGGLRSALEDQARRLGLERHVRFLGNRTDIGPLLATMDVFVLSSRREGLPLALLEAVAGQIPVVSTDVGGISEVIESGVDGLLVPPADPPALAAALGRTLGDRDAAMIRARAARAKFDRSFTAEAMVGNHERLYEDLLSAVNE